MNAKKLIALVLSGVALVFLSSALRAAPTGAVSAKLTLEFKGKTFPVSAAQVTILDRAIDLGVVDFKAKQGAEQKRNKERAYHSYRYTYLVREIQNSRRVGVRQLRSGIITKRTDNTGEVLIRYLEPGDYFIGAYCKSDSYSKMGEKAVVWFIPFSVTAGRVEKVDLDNKNAFELYDPELYP